jgi:hypothetical protein
MKFAHVKTFADLPLGAFAQFFDFNFGDDGRTPAVIASRAAFVSRSRSAALIAFENFLNGFKNGLSCGFATSCLSICRGRGSKRFFSKRRERRWGDREERRKWVIA